MKKSTLIAFLIVTSFSAIANNQVSHSDSFELQLVCSKIESEGSENKIESEGSENKIESEGSENKIESEGSENKIESEGSENKIGNNCTTIIVKN